MAISLHYLARSHHLRGDHAIAAPISEEAVKVARGAWSPGTPFLATVLAGHGELLLDEGRHGEAEPLLREALTIRESSLAEEHWQRAETEALLGACLAERGEAAEAPRLLERALPVLREERGPDDRLTRRAEAALRRVRGG